VPGHKYWRTLNAKKVPVYSVVLAAVVAALLTLPALVKVDINGAPVPIAFFAVVSIGVIGLYVAFAIPIFLRWRMADRFVPGNWTLGSKYKWMCIVAVAEIAITSIIALLPTSSGGVPWNDAFAMKYVNYTILVVPVALLLLWIWWHVSVKKWFTGPRTTLDLPAARQPGDPIASSSGDEVGQGV
jgi:hypothetical protein